jgi:hypothetical protein
VIVLGGPSEARRDHPERRKDLTTEDTEATEEEIRKTLDSRD